MAFCARLLPHLTAVVLFVGFAPAAMTQAADVQPAASSTTAKNQAAKVTRSVKITKPLWSELKPTQHVALAPLQGEWLKMSEAQKRKWLELSKNYDKLSNDEQTKLHARMTDWARLSPEERATARLNFSAAKTLSAEEKQKKWDAYQALSPEEKAKLQAKAKASTPNSAALAAKPQNKVLPGKASAANPVSPAAALVPAEK